MPIQINGATSGSATVQATDAATVTLTLPATSGTLAVGGTTPTFTSLTVTNDASISGLTVGKGGGSVSTNTAVGFTAIGSLSGATTGANNSAFGGYAGAKITSGADNTFIGYASAYQNTTGASNTAVGKDSLLNNTTASNNTAVGYQAGYSNTTGYDNVVMGQGALYSNSTGIRLTAVGKNALNANTASYNDAFGAYALEANTTGTQNSGIGYGTLNKNTTGSSNFAGGYQALAQSTTASSTAAVGYQAGYSQTTGGANVLVGYQAGYTNQVGGYNVYIGYLSGYSCTSSTGNGNVFVGQQSGYSTTTGISNTFIGPSAGYYMTTGSKNTILGNFNGNQGGADIRTASNYIIISDGDGSPAAFWNGTNAWNVNSISGQRFSYLQYRINGSVLANTYADNVANAFFVIAGGSGGVFLANTGTSWTSNSDARLKNVTGTFTNALADVAQLEAVKFTWKSDESNKPCVGLIAQSVEKVLPEAVTKTASIKDDDTEYLGVQYTEVVPLLVAAIQELNAKVTALEAQLGAK